MAKRAVKIIRDAETIGTLSDLVRREIIRLVAAQPLNGTQLAQRLSLSKTSTGYHLQKLLRAGLITISSTEVGPHGILEKYYEPTSMLFLEDFERTPPDLRRYFVHGHMERLRGMLSAFRMIDERGEQIEMIDPEELKDLAQELARQMTAIGERYENSETSKGRENLLIEIYSEALRSVVLEGRWRKFFPVLETKT